MCFGPSRGELKQRLFEAVDGTVTGASATASKAAEVDACCAALERRTPSRRPLRETALSCRWKLIYTTEADVHPFLLRKFLGLPTKEVWQKIDQEGARITNGIELAGGIAIRAGAPLQVQTDKRIAYFFDWVMIKLGPLELKVPLESGPGGWTEVVYLDDELRVMRNFRQDLLILVRDED